MLLGKKIGMTSVYDEQGNLLPVTVIQAGPCMVMQVKKVETDGYNAIQLGFDDVKKSRRKKPQTGHADKANTAPKRFVREMRLPDESEPEHKPGDSLTVSVFADTEFVDVIGTSKGKGFAGVMKRHNFGGFALIDMNIRDRSSSNSSDDFQNRVLCFGITSPHGKTIHHRFFKRRHIDIRINILCQNHAQS